MLPKNIKPSSKFKDVETTTATAAAAAATAIATAAAKSKRIINMANYTKLPMDTNKKATRMVKLTAIWLIPMAKIKIIRAIPPRNV